MREEKCVFATGSINSTLERAPTTPAPLGEAFPSNNDWEDLAGTPRLDEGKLLKEFSPNNCILSCTSAVQTVFLFVKKVTLECLPHSSAVPYLTVFFLYQLPSPTILFFLCSLRLL